jgi:hypothetical protein
MLTVASIAMTVSGRLGMNPATRVLTAEDESRMVVASAQQVLGEVQPGIGKPARSRHGVAIECDRSVGAYALDLEEIPDGPPECLSFGDAPLIEGIVIAELPICPSPCELHETRQPGAGDPFGGRRPERRVVHVGPSAAAQCLLQLGHDLEEVADEADIGSLPMAR